jgi:hypothetical protein
LLLFFFPFARDVKMTPGMRPTDTKARDQTCVKISDVFLTVPGRQGHLQSNATRFAVFCRTSVTTVCHERSQTLNFQIFRPSAEF